MNIQNRYTQPRLAIMFLVIACACSGTEDEADISERAKIAVKNDSNDICSARGWYGDGTCDGDYCAMPDPDCGCPTGTMWAGDTSKGCEVSPSEFPLSPPKATADLKAADSFAVSSAKKIVYYLDAKTKIVYERNAVTDATTKLYTLQSDAFDLMLDEKDNRLLYLRSEDLFQLPLDTLVPSRIGRLDVKTIQDDPTNPNPSKVLSAKFDHVANKVIAFAFIQDPQSSNVENGTRELVAFDPVTLVPTRLTTNLLEVSAYRQFRVEWHVYPVARTVFLSYFPDIDFGRNGFPVDLDTGVKLPGLKNSPTKHEGFSVLAYQPKADRYYFYAAKYGDLFPGGFARIQGDGTDLALLNAALLPRLPNRTPSGGEPDDYAWFYSEETNWLVSVGGDALDLNTMTNTKLF